MRRGGRDNNVEVHYNSPRLEGESAATGVLSLDATYMQVTFVCLCILKRTFVRS